MDYHCISADCHIDLCWLPYDLFIANASSAMKDRMPYVKQTADGPKWVTKSGVDLGYANGKGSGGVVGRGLKYTAGKEHRIDRMASTGLYTDSVQGIFRPTTPALRVQDQDRDGIQAEVLYGLLHAGGTLTDREAAIEFYRVYNDWLAGFCRYDRKRFIGLASIPSHTVEAAVAETHRVAKLGLGGLDFPYSYEMTPLWDAYWDPFWKAAAEVNLPVHFHTVGPPPSAPGRDSSATAKVVAQATRMAGFQLYMANILASIIHGGAFDRYPNLRIVLGESGIGWIPYVLQRMDSEYEERFKTDLPIKMKPSEYWRRHCRATFQNDQVGVMNLEMLGIDTVMWASDYPHPDSVFPDSQEYIKRQFHHLSSRVQRQITCENAGKFYGLMN